MARDSGGMGSIFKLALVGGAGWFGYNYLVNSGLWGQWFGASAGSSQLPQPAAPITSPAAGSSGGAASNTGTPPATPPNPPATTPRPGLRTQLIAMAGGPGIQLDVDQWVYYYSQFTGVAVTGAQVNTMLNATGGSATNRATQITVDQFLAVLPTAGLSGLGALPPVPLMLARRGWGAKTPARALPPNYVRRGAPMIHRRR